MSVAWHAEGARLDTPKAVAGGPGRVLWAPHGLGRSTVQTAAVLQPEGERPKQPSALGFLPAPNEGWMSCPPGSLHTWYRSGLFPIHSSSQRCSVGSSAQNGSALKREFSGGSYNTKRQPMPSPSEGSLSSGGMDQGSDAPARDYDGEVNG